MEDRAEELRRRIELYRGYLRDGADARLAQGYLEQIRRDQRELAEIETRRRRLKPI